MQFGVYIHFPYCLSKCPYCDFASRAEAVIPQQRYTEAVLRELGARAAQFPGREALSIYFGGGTPSLWDPPQLGRVLREIRSLWSVRTSAEVTLEANPGTTDEERFAAFRELGVNRLSIGVQSFAPAQLVALGRKHSGGDAVRAFETARAAGFRNVSLDLIHGVERQTKELAASDAASAVALGPEHISCYALTLTGLAEEVPMARALRRGELALPDDEVVSDMGDAVRAELAQGGYARYEISNYARRGREAVHNSLYWRGGEYGRRVAAPAASCARAAAASDLQTTARRRGTWSGWSAPAPATLLRSASRRTNTFGSESSPACVSPKASTSRPSNATWTCPSATGTAR